MIRVLLVDDDPEDREVTKLALGAVDSEISVHCVLGAASCLWALRHSSPPFDAVLLDLQLVVGDKRPGGLALLPLIRVPAIILTGSDDYRPAAASRAAAYILKGTSAYEIARTIRKVLGR